MTNHQTDQLADQLLDAGLVASRYVLDLNHGLTVPWEMLLPAPWNLPSRLFRFPIEVSEPVEEQRRIGLMHPQLKDHPWVKYVEGKLGLTLEAGGAPNEFGVSNCSTALWWHAVDLVSAGLWRDLIETRQFTTDADIAGAVAYGLTYSPHDADRAAGYLSTPDARQLMKAIGSPEPSDRAAVVLCFDEPRPCRSEKSVERWPINTGPRRDRALEAWGYILGIEGGWFRYDCAGFLDCTQVGRDRYAAGAASSFTEATGQGRLRFENPAHDTRGKSR